MKKSILVQMRNNLEARPIANLVQLASRFSSTVYFEKGTARVNAKSIMGMMGLALVNGEEATIDAEGSDAAEAIAAIEKFLTE